MLKSTKIILAAISVTLIICIVIVGVSIGVSKNKKQEDPSVLDPSVSSSQPLTSATENTEDTSTTEAPLSKQIIGAWMDSVQMSGFEFFDDGRVTVTFINLTIPFLDLPINGTANGTYTLEGSVLTMKYSIYSHTEVRTYTVSVSQNELTMINSEDNNLSTYQRVDKLTEQKTDSAANEDLEGTWVDSESKIRYTFHEDSTVTASFSNAVIPSISDVPLNGTYSGNYLSQQNKLIIQLTIGNIKTTRQLNYAVTTNSLSLTDESGKTDLFSREGTGNSVPSIFEVESLIGTWKDSTGSSGYKFNDGGVVEITYVDFVVPVINMPINGKFKGTYSVNGNEITLRYSALGRYVSSTYTYSVSGNTLTMTDKDSGKVSTYTK